MNNDLVNDVLILPMLFIHRTACCNGHNNVFVVVCGCLLYLLVIYTSCSQMYLLCLI